MHFKLCICTKKKEENNLSTVKANLIKKVIGSPKIGAGVCVTEDITLLGDGKKEKVTIFYDKGSDTTLILKNLEKMGKKRDHKNVAVELADGSTTYMSNTPVLEFKQQKENENKNKNITHAQEVKKTTDMKTFEVPFPRQGKYQPGSSVKGPEGRIQRVQGMERNEPKPEQFSRKQDNSLSNNQITEKPNSKEYTDLKGAMKGEGEKFPKTRGIKDFANSTKNQVFMNNLLHKNKLQPLENNQKKRKLKCLESLTKNPRKKHRVGVVVKKRSHAETETRKKDHKVKKSYVPFDRGWNQLQMNHLNNLKTKQVLPNDEKFPRARSAS